MRFSAFIKFIALSLVLFFAIFLVKTPAFAQSIAPQITPQATQTQPNLVPDTNPGVPNNLHIFSQSLMLEILSSLSCNLSGKDLLAKNGLCLGADPNTGKLGYIQNNNGAIGAMSGMIAILYTPPLHTSDFIAYMGQNFGIAKPSYAQVTGIGFIGLTPLLHAWVVFRNIVYLLFVFAFILIGLAIMMRLKIDPRTVMTIQNQIPKIIVSLVLVTFSFAIAGFLVDMMWVSTYVVINVMHEADDRILPSEVAKGIYSPAPQFANDVLNDKTAAFSLGGVHSIAYNGAGAIADIVHKFISPDTLPPVIPPQATSNSGGGGGGCGFPIGCLTNTLGDIGKGITDLPATIAGFVLGPIGDIVGGILSNLISWTVGIIAYLILICALLIALLKLWFALLKAYISILIDVIFAPFWIVAGLIPGQTSAGFGPWLRDMAGNLAAFPAAIMMLLLAKLFSDSFITGTVTAGNSNIFTGNISSTAFVPPLIGSGASGYLSSLIALGIVLATPGIVDMTKKAFKAPEMKMGAIGQSFGAGAAFIGNPTKKFGKAMFGHNERSGQANPGTAFVGRHLGPTMQKVLGGGNQPNDLAGNEIPTGSFKGALGKIPGAKAAGGAAKAAGARVAKIPYVGPVARGAAKVGGKIGGTIGAVKKWAGPPAAAPQAPTGSNPAQAQGGTQTIVTPQTPTPPPLITNPSVVAKILHGPKKL